LNSELKNISEDPSIRDRYTNRNGLKFYLERTELSKNGRNETFEMSFFATPKNYSNHNHKNIFKIIASDEFLSDNKLSEIKEEYVSKCGYYEFLKWLNEINELKSQTFEFKMLSGNKVILSQDSNGIFQLPNNDEDDMRLRNLAEEIIFKEFYNNIRDKKFSDEDLKEKCFVPNDIFNGTYRLLKRQNYLDLENFQLTTEGISYYKNTSKFDSPQSRFSRTVFVAQAFSPDLIDFYNTMYKPIIESKVFNLNPIQINNEEFDENIDNEIMNQIRQCRFMICDLTYARPSVYFEAGYALGRGVKIIYTCRNDHNSDEPNFDASKFKVHFDIRNRKISFWEMDELEDFKKRLIGRIKQFLDLQNQNK